MLRQDLPKVLQLVLGYEVVAETRSLRHLLLDYTLLEGLEEYGGRIFAFVSFGYDFHNSSLLQKTELINYQEIFFHKMQSMVPENIGVMFDHLVYFVGSWLWQRTTLQSDKILSLIIATLKAFACS